MRKMICLLAILTSMVVVDATGVVNPDTYNVNVTSSCISNPRNAEFERKNKEKQCEVIENADVVEKPTYYELDVIATGYCKEPYFHICNNGDLY